MKITNGIKIAMANKPLCYKTLFSRTVVSVVALIVCLLFANIVLSDIVKSKEFANLFDFSRQFVKSYLLAENIDKVQKSTEFTNHIIAIFNMIKSNVSEIIWVAVAILIVIQLAKFIIGLCDYVVAVNVNEHMSSMRHAEFFTTLIEHFAPACRYALYYVISLFLFNTVVIAISIALFALFVKLVGVFAITLVVLFVVFVDAFRFVIVGMLPAKMVCEKMTSSQAFKDSFKGLTFKIIVDRFISYFVLRLISIAVTIMFAVSTFYVSLIVTIPLFSVTYMAVRFVDYYNVKEKKYYLTFDEIVVPKVHRTKEEQLLNQVDIDV